MSNNLNPDKILQIQNLICAFSIDILLCQKNNNKILFLCYEVLKKFHHNSCVNCIINMINKTHFYIIKHHNSLSNFKVLTKKEIPVHL